MFPVFNIVDVNCTDVDKKGDSGRRGSSAVEAQLEKKAEDFTRYATEEEVLYSTANDPETANNPQNGPQMILDRK